MLKLVIGALAALFFCLPAPSSAPLPEPVPAYTGPSA